MTTTLAKEGCRHGEQYPRHPNFRKRLKHNYGFDLR